MSIVHHSFCSLYEIWVTEISFCHYWDRLLSYHRYQCQMIASIANLQSLSVLLRRIRSEFETEATNIAENGKLVMRECRWRGAAYTTICDSGSHGRVTFA